MDQCFRQLVLFVARKNQLLLKIKKFSKLINKCLLTGEKIARFAFKS